MIDPALDFEAAWDVASTIPGWLTEEQARLLFDDRPRPAGRSPSSLEIGSHQGKSTVVLATAARAHGGRVVAVDPFVDGRLFGGASTRDKFEGNLARRRADRHGGAAARVQHPRPTHAGSRDLDYLYIDGKHDYWTLSRRPASGPRTCPPARRSWSTTATPRSASPSGCWRTCCPPARLRYERRAGLAGAVPGRHPDRGRPACASCARCRGGCATSPSRCCCGCGCAPWPRARSATRARTTPTDRRRSPGQPRSVEPVDPALEELLAAVVLRLDHLVERDPPVPPPTTGPHRSAPR